MKRTHTFNVVPTFDPNVMTQEEWVRQQGLIYADYQSQIADMVGKASGNHPTKKPASKRVQAKIKAQKESMKLAAEKAARRRKEYADEYREFIENPNFKADEDCW